MRKALSAVLVVAMVIAVGAAPPAIQAQTEGQEQKGVGLGERIQDLSLTEDQEAKIAEIRKEFRPKVQEAAKAVAALVKEEMEKARAVLTPDQKTKLAELKQERKEFRRDRLVDRIANLKELDLTDAEMAKIAEIRKEFRPKVEKIMAGLKGTLTDEQRTAWREAAKAGKSRREILASLKVTDDQKAKVEAVGKELRSVCHEELTQIRD
jgi:Spy/CpxP family protein refolding chaperone